MDTEITLTILDTLVIFAVVVVGNLFSIGYVRFRDRLRRRQMMEDFLSHIQEKIQTEEEFQEIVDRFRKDMRDDE